MAVAAAVAVHHQTLVMAELLPQIGQTEVQDQKHPTILTYKQVVKVVQEDNFQRFRELVQMMKMQHRAQGFLVVEQVAVA
tara:strand:+ start:393 stop:632 length:240 start_codon:yes stop_codon:yes gene_type:complete